MGGKEGSRGYYYQGIVAVIEALKRHDWTHIYVEFPTSGDKVDIAFQNETTFTDAYQVKSTVNSFERADIRNWLKEITSDFQCHNYQLILIGNCTVSAQKYINAVRKYQDGTIDAEVKKQLDNSDEQLLSENRIFFDILPFDTDKLKSLARDALWDYTTCAEIPLERPQAVFLVDALIEGKILLATEGKYIEREEFRKNIDERINLFIKKSTKKREKIGILSFRRGTDPIQQEMQTLDLRDKFDGRCLKRGLNWNVDIGIPVQKYLNANTNHYTAYQIYIDAHAAIAFAAGRVFDTKAGVDICPVQKTTSGSELWDANISGHTEYPQWDIEQKVNNENSSDTALILNLSHIIEADVIRYIRSNNIPIRNTYIFTPHINGGTVLSVKNGTHALLLVTELIKVLSSRDSQEKQAYIHIFASAPNAFMFILGQQSRTLGKCIIYEYDFEQRGNCSYIPAIIFDGREELE